VEADKEMSNHADVGIRMTRLFLITLLVLSSVPAHATESPKSVWVLVFSYSFGDFKPPNRVIVPLVFETRKACLDETAYLGTDHARTVFRASEVPIIVDCTLQEVLKTADSPAPNPRP
jgi:hypothetical protein